MTNYEKRDVRFAAIAKGFGGLMLLLAVVALASSATLRAFHGEFLASVRRPPPPPPRLQPDPAADLRRLRSEEAAELSGYAWADRSRGLIRVPIERAMELLLRRGLPTRGAGARARP